MTVIVTLDTPFPLGTTWLTSRLRGPRGFHPIDDRLATMVFRGAQITTKHMDELRLLCALVEQKEVTGDDITTRLHRTDPFTLDCVGLVDQCFESVQHTGFYDKVLTEYDEATLTRYRFRERLEVLLVKLYRDCCAGCVVPNPVALIKDKAIYNWHGTCLRSLTPIHWSGLFRSYASSDTSDFVRVLSWVGPRPVRDHICYILFNERRRTCFDILLTGRHGHLLKPGDLVNALTDMSVLCQNPLQLARFREVWQLARPDAAAKERIRKKVNTINNRSRKRTGATYTLWYCMNTLDPTFFA